MDHVKKMTDSAKLMVLNYNNELRWPGSPSGTVHNFGTELISNSVARTLESGWVCAGVCLKHNLRGEFSS